MYTNYLKNLYNNLIKNCLKILFIWGICDIIGNIKKKGIYVEIKNFT